MANSFPNHKLCNFCRKRESISTYKIYQGSKISNYIVIAATITKEYLLVPICEICDEELNRTQNYCKINGILAIVCIIVSVFAISSLQIEMERNKTIFYDLMVLVFAVVPFIHIGFNTPSACCGFIML